MRAWQKYGSELLENIIVKHAIIMFKHTNIMGEAEKYYVQVPSGNAAWQHWHHRGGKRYKGGIRSKETNIFIKDQVT